MFIICIHSTESWTELDLCEDMCHPAGPKEIQDLQCSSIFYNRSLS